MSPGPHPCVLCKGGNPPTCASGTGNVESRGSGKNRAGWPRLLTSLMPPHSGCRTAGREYFAQKPMPLDSEKQTPRSGIGAR